MKIRLGLASPGFSAARWSRRLGVVAGVVVAGVVAAPATSYAPAASVAVRHHQGREADAGPADSVVQASTTSAVAGPSVVDGVPAPALRAYRFAAAVLARTDPKCGLDWSLLAAIGDVESDHGRYGGSVLLADGTSSPPILGPRLDGDGDVAAITDTDNGSLDGDQRWDRAVGPMQFIPSTWAVVGSDADGDDVRDPRDIDDAALSAAAYLCAGPGDLSTFEGQRSAVFRYNPSRAYVDLVLRLAAAYARQRFGPRLPTPEPRGGGVEVPRLTATVDRPAHPATPPREDAAVMAPALLAGGHNAGHTAGIDTSMATSRRRHDGSARTGTTPARRSPGGTNDSLTGGNNTRRRTGGGSVTARNPAASADSTDAGSTVDGTSGDTSGGTSGGDTSGGTSGGSTSGGGTSGGGTSDGGTSGGGASGGGTSDGGTSGGGTSDGGTSGGGTSGGGTSDGSGEQPPAVSGALQRSDDGTWSVAGNTVDFGDDAYLDNEALNDFDGADGVESNRGELETLLGQDVTVELEQDTQVVVRLNDLAYR